MALTRRRGVPRERRCGPSPGVAVSRFLRPLTLTSGVALLGLGWALVRAEEPGGKPDPELAAVRKERAELEARVAALKQQELSLERAAEARANGYYARVEVKGRLGKKVVPPGGPFAPDETVEWTVTAGENSYELFFGNSPSPDAFLKLAEERAGTPVVVAGELAAPRHPTPQLLVVKSFGAPKE